MARIAIIDDHPVMRKGLAMQIRLEPDLEVCGEADDVPEALRVIEDTAPDMAIVDVSLKSGNGIDLVKRLRERNSTVPVLIYSMYAESLYADRALRAGALGYISKEASPDTVIAAIRRVLSGKPYLSPEMSDRMLTRVIRGQAGVHESPLEALSDRELETFTLIGQGLTTREIAVRLNLSIKTIESFRTRVKDKLDIDTTAELARRASQWVIENG